METNEVVKSVMENEEVGAQVSELIEAGKNVVVDLKSDGSAVVTEVAKSGIKDALPVIGVAGGSFALGILVTLGVVHGVKKHKEKKEAKELEKAFAEKAEAAAKEAEKNGGKVDDAVDVEEAKTEKTSSDKAA